ncbi:MAG: hypothetical protein H7Z10_06400 [Gemmatimonadaceae bacterium]|nr:hypothetical protein [Acetobacteraceae bacterium]
MLAIGGGVLIVGAVAMYLSGSSDYAAARDELTDQARRDSHYDDANTKRHIAIGMGVAGVACGGIAAWWYLRGRAAETDATTKRNAGVQLAPFVGTATGLAVRGAF